MSILGVAGVRSRRRSGIVLPSFRRCVDATDSPRYGVVLTLTLVIGGGVMASFGGVSPPTTKMAPVPLMMLLSASIGVVSQCLFS